MTKKTNNHGKRKGHRAIIGRNFFQHGYGHGFDWRGMRINVCYVTEGSSDDLQIRITATYHGITGTHAIQRTFPVFTVGVIYAFMKDAKEHAMKCLKWDHEEVDKLRASLEEKTYQLYMKKKHLK